MKLIGVNEINFTQGSGEIFALVALLLLLLPSFLKLYVR